MPRQGRNLEILVSSLERLLGGTGIQLTSPDYIVGRSSGSRREVDIALRAPVGSSNVLVIVECRDRNDIADVTWIEQLATKRQDVGADKAVAVSAAGFTSGAANAAKHYDIPIRTLKQVDLSEVLLWFPFREITFDGLGMDMHHIDIVLDSKALGSTMPSLTTIDRVQFRAKHSGTWALLWQHLWNDIPGPKLYEQIPADGTRIRHILPISFPNEQSRYQLETSAGLVDVIQVIIQADLWIERKQIPVGLVASYVDQDQTLALVAQFRIEHGTARLEISLAESADGEKRSISVSGATDPNVASFVDLDVVSTSDVSADSKVVRMVIRGR